MMNLTKIPVHMHQAVRDYIEHGLPPGDFLTAVLTNNLVEAVGRADDVNIHAIREWAHLLYWELPSDSWGSPAKIEAWIAKHEAARTCATKDENERMT